MTETEKVTINMSVVDLGQIDLLVDEGFYSSRTDFIRTATRNLLTSHGEVVRQSITKRNMVIGVTYFTRKDLEKSKDRGERWDVRVVGLFMLSDDISPELARETINSILVLGVFRASHEVKTALADRIR